ncbi:uncharacterized protein LOC126787697 [Argentina anserina]|uniref:uncharacterized protein LOC126787697 n=1 Tax=Argentina anserina TaxID=57926 RepID=UPI0021765CC1|nr:uncharacterized protein LOC126787697 [Potentilla anserina]
MELAGGERKRVVVIGGGVAGSLLAKSLQFSADFTLIDKKEYFEIPWASLRTMVEPSFGERSLINHRDYLTNGQIITSGAINITDTEVLTGEGRLVPYDYLVIATGHADSVPKSKNGRLQEFQEDNLKIRSANSILIVGGGPTGVELAGEIATDFPDKKITLVHTGSRLLEFIGPKAGNKTLNWFHSRNVEVILEQSVSLDRISESPGRKTYQTSEGQMFEADCHFICIGKRLGSAWLKETVLKSSLDLHGRLMVDQNLRVKGRQNIFAIGDITDIPEIKQGYLAQKQALVAAKNLKLLLAGGRESKLATYEAHSGVALVSLGRKHGVAQFPYTTCIGRIPGLIKSKDLFVGKTRKQLGLEEA